MKSPRRILAIAAVALLAFLSLGTSAHTATIPITFSTPVTMPGSAAKGSEPSMAITEDGTRFVSWQSPGELASSPNGLTFKQVATPDPAALGDVTTAADAFGSVYNGEFCSGATSLHACLHKSTNKGATWRKTDFTDHHPGAADRPWIDVWPHHIAPYPGGTPADLAPADTDHTVVYMEYHTFSPEDLTYITVSKDGGATFSEPKLISLGTNALAGSLCNTVPGGIAVGADGTAYALWISPEDVTVSASGCNYSEIGPFTKAWVSVSHDLGATWNPVLAWHGAFDLAARTGDNASKLFATITVGRDGQVHVVVPARRMDDPTRLAVTCPVECVENSAKTDLVVVTSPDQGEHWTPEFSFNPSGGTNFFPAAAAGSGGVLDLIYYRSPTLKPNVATNVWNIGFSQITGLQSQMQSGQAVYVGTPSIDSVLLSSAPVHKGGICTFGTFCAAVPGANRRLADAIVVAVDPAGGANAAWTTDQPSGTSHIQFACQNAGASAFAGSAALAGCYAKAAPATGVIYPISKPTVQGKKNLRGPLPATGIADNAPLGLALTLMAALMAAGLAAATRKRTA